MHATVVYVYVYIDWFLKRSAIPLQIQIHEITMYDSLIIIQRSSNDHPSAQSLDYLGRTILIYILQCWRILCHLILLVDNWRRIFILDNNAMVLSFLCLWHSAALTFLERVDALDHDILLLHNFLWLASINHGRLFNLRHFCLIDFMISLCY